MTESKFISLLTRDLSNELTSTERSTLTSFAGDPDFESMKSSIDGAWNAAESYRSDFDVDIDLAFDKFATKFNIPTSNVSPKPSKDVNLQSLFLKVAAAITIIIAGLFTFNYLNVNSHFLTNETNSVAHYDISKNLQLSLTPGSSYQLSEENDLKQLYIDGKAHLTFNGNNERVEILTDDLKVGGVPGLSISAIDQNAKGSHSDQSDMNANHSSQDNQATSVTSSTSNSNDDDVVIRYATFSVENFDKQEDISIHVNNGAVNVKNNKTNEASKLGADQTLTYNKTTNQWAIFDDKPSIEWVDNKLSFNNTPIEDVFKEIEIYFGVKIDVKGDVPQNCHFTAQNIKNPTAKSIFSTLHTSFNLGVERTSLKSYTVSNITCK